MTRNPSAENTPDASRPADLSWVARPYDPADRTAILSLIRSYYGAIETANGAFFDWQYFENPSGPVVLWLAHGAGSAIVGQHVLLPMRFLIDGAPADSALSFNALVDPRYHGKGIWTGLGRKAHDEARSRGVRMTYGIPNPNSHRPMVKDLEYRRVFDVPVLVKPLDLAGAVRGVVKGLPGRILSGPAGLARPILFPRARVPRNAPLAVPVDRFDSAYDTLARISGQRYRVLLNRDAAHLNWRYVDCPTRSTLRWAVRQGSRVAGYLVLRVTDFRGLKMGILLDLLTDGTPEGRMAGIALAAEAEAAARQEGCTLLLGFCLAHTMEFSLLERSGWKVGPARLLPQPFPLLVRGLQMEPTDPDLAEPRNWYLSTGDYDVF